MARGRCPKNTIRAAQSHGADRPDEPLRRTRDVLPRGFVSFGREVRPVGAACHADEALPACRHNSVTRRRAVRSKAAHATAARGKLAATDDALRRTPPTTRHKRRSVSIRRDDDAAKTRTTRGVQEVDGRTRRHNGEVPHEP